MNAQRLLRAGIFLLVMILLLPTRIYAQQGPTIPDDQCMLCHSDPELSMVLPSNEVLPLGVDTATLQHSVHGETDEPLNCVDCHNDMSGYPHADFPALDYRDWQLQISQVCGNCHEEEAMARQESIHARLLAAGRSEAATCIDCHGAHDVPLADPTKLGVDRMAQLDACGQCHSTVVDEFRRSIHGQQLAEGNLDVPTCSNCHPAHHIEDPRSAQFRLKSPELCGQCHADKALMAKYDISTAVFDTYVADFHGTTVKIFEDLEPDKITNKAVCSDCHSAHLILPPTDENSSVIQSNLTATCQRCHPDADNSFTASWMGHYPPDWEHHPLVTAVNWFYKLLIPGVLGFFVVYIGLDVSRTTIERSRRRREWRLARRKQEKKEGGDQ
ncbi:MAG: hypothetical protein GXP38_12640 [Chloroflexi bacterium]|nr:hypothetical protein [Chloroflexota bacterium]